MSRFYFSLLSNGLSQGVALLIAVSFYKYADDVTLVTYIVIVGINVFAMAVFNLGVTKIYHNMKVEYPEKLQLLSWYSMWKNVVLCAIFFFFALFYIDSNFIVLTYALVPFLRLVSEYKSVGFLHEDKKDYYINQRLLPNIFNIIY